MRVRRSKGGILMSELEQPKKKKRRFSARALLSVLLVLAGLGLLAYYVTVDWVPKWKQQIAYRNALDLSIPTVEDLSLPADSGSGSDSGFVQDNYDRYTYPTDHFFLTDQRKAYKSGQLRLIVPRLALDCEVRSGTADSVIKYSPGLYKYSALPSYGNPNVCIAAHRGVYGAEFYNIDKFADGDLIFLEYNGYRFTYEYVETVVVHPDDWSMLYCTDYSAVTLTSCHPMDTSADRMCVRGKLLKAEPIESAGGSSNAAGSNAASTAP